MPLGVCETASEFHPCPARVTSDFLNGMGLVFTTSQHQAGLLWLFRLEGI